MPESPKPDPASDWPILVLTLEGDADRRAPLVEALTARAIGFTTLAGIDGRNGLPATCESRIDRAAAKERYGRMLSDAEFACGLSHQSAYAQILREGWPGAVILEDDAIPARGFFDFLQVRGYTRSDLILLYHSHARVRGPSIPLAPGIDGRRLSLPARGAVGYSVSARAARYLVAAGTPLSDVADWPGDITALGSLAVTPLIVEHPNGTGASSALEAGRTKVRSRPGRFLQPGYWRRWWLKRTSRRIT